MFQFPRFPPAMRVIAQERLGCPIRRSWDRRLLGASPTLIAAVPRPSSARNAEASTVCSLCLPSRNTWSGLLPGTTHVDQGSPIRTKTKRQENDHYQSALCLTGQRHHSGRRTTCRTETCRRDEVGKVQTHDESGFPRSLCSGPSPLKRVDHNGLSDGVC